MAEYAVANKIDAEPAFSWWVHYVFKKQDSIISKAKTKYWRTKHKYGVRLPKTAVESHELDRQTGQTIWGNSLKKRWARQKYHTRKLKVVRLKNLGDVILMN